MRLGSAYLTEGTRSVIDGEEVLLVPMQSGGRARIRLDHAARCAEAARERAEAIHMTTVSLYELNEQLKRLETLLLQQDGEYTPEQEAELVRLLDGEKGKIDSYRHMARHFDLSDDVLAGEIELLQKKRQGIAAAKARLHDRLLKIMDERGVKELRGEMFKASKQANGTKPVSVFIDPSQLPAQFKRVKVEADKTALKAAADKEGKVQVDGLLIAQVEPAGFHVRWY